MTKRRERQGQGPAQKGQDEEEDEGGKDDTAVEPQDSHAEREILFPRPLEVHPRAVAVRKGLGAGEKDGEVVDGVRVVEGEDKVGVVAVRWSDVELDRGRVARADGQGDWEGILTFAVGSSDCTYQLMRRGPQVIRAATTTQWWAAKRRVRLTPDDRRRWHQTSSGRMAPASLLLFLVSSSTVPTDQDQT